MSDLGPLKSVVRGRHVETMMNGRMRNLVKFDIDSKQTVPAIVDSNIIPVDRVDALDTRVVGKKEYQYVPPAAKRFYLWDSTATGVTFVTQTQNVMTHAQINFIALNNVLTVLERHGFKEPGFLLGYVDTEKFIFDRFDMGRNNCPTMLLNGDELIKIFFRDTSRDNYKNLVLELEKYVSSLSVVLHYPWILNIQVKEEELMIVSTRIIPKVSLKYFGIPSIRIVPSNLVLDLQGSTEIRYGFMAIDQARHVVFLKEELRNLDFCLVGMWVNGIEDIKSQFITQLSVYYLMNRALSKLGNSFLICLYAKDARFYQVNYQLEKDDFYFQKAELQVSMSNSDQNILLEFDNIDIGKDKEFCSAYKEVYGVDLAVETEEYVQEEVIVQDNVDCELNTNNGHDIEEDKQCLDESKEQDSVTDKQKDDTVPECDKTTVLEQIPMVRMDIQTNDSQNQNWVYLTLLQQQIDILRTQMMHLMNKENKCNQVSVSTNTPSLSSQEFGMNTSFITDVPETKEVAVQVEEEPVPDKLSTFLDIAEELNLVEPDSKLPFDTGSNYKPFFSVSKVEEDVKEDSPETTFSKSMIAQLAENPNASFIYSETHAKQVSQVLPDESSMNTTVLSTGHSFATQEYLKRHGLLNESLISVPSSTFLKPARSDYKVLDSMRLKSLGKLL